MKKKTADEIKVTESIPPLVNEQCVVYVYEMRSERCRLCGPYLYLYTLKLFATCIYSTSLPLFPGSLELHPYQPPMINFHTLLLLLALFLNFVFCYIENITSLHCTSMYATTDFSPQVLLALHLYFPACALAMLVMFSSFPSSAL